MASPSLTGSFLAQNTPIPMDVSLPISSYLKLRNQIDKKTEKRYAQIGEITVPFLVMILVMILGVY